MRVVFYGDYAIKQVRPIYEAAGWKCDEYRATGGNPAAKPRELFKLISADCVYIVSGCDVQSTSAYRLAVKLKKRVVVHWIGTDVLRIREDYYKNPRKINAECENYAVVSWLKDELSEIGIDSEELPIVPLDIDYECAEAPDNHSILTYIPEHRAAFYNYGLMKRLAEELPEVKFCVVGNNGMNDHEKLKNIEYFGWLDRDQMQALIKDCTILFRYPEHDGFPRMIVEALAAGRKVVYKYRYPYVITPASNRYEDILAALKNVLAEKPSVDYEASDYIKNNFSKEKMLAKYRELGLI